MIPAPALAEADRALRALYGERLAGALLFGSHARGSATAASDVDVLVVLDGVLDDYREVKRLAAVEVDLLLRFGVDFHLLPLSAERFARRDHPLVQRVRTEAVPLTAKGAG